MNLQWSNIRINKLTIIIEEFNSLVYLLELNVIGPWSPKWHKQTLTKVNTKMGKMTYLISRVFFYAPNIIIV